MYFNMADSNLKYLLKAGSLAEGFIDSSMNAIKPVFNSTKAKKDPPMSIVPEQDITEQLEGYKKTQEDFYQVTTEGIKYYKQEEGERFIQRDYIIEDGIEVIEDYPFSLECTGRIMNINIKTNNINITISEGLLVTDSPVLVEIRNNTLNIWTPTYFPNKVLNNKGKSVINGYKVDNYDGKRIKIKNKFEINQWNLFPLEVDTFIVKGKYNVITIKHNIFGNKVSMKVSGENNILSVCPIHLTNADIFTTCNDIDFSESTVDNLMLEQANGNFKGLHILKRLVIIMTQGQARLKVDDNTDISQTIHGHGTISFI